MCPPLFTIDGLIEKVLELAVELSNGLGFRDYQTGKQRIKFLDPIWALNWAGVEHADVSILFLERNSDWPTSQQRRLILRLSICNYYWPPHIVLAGEDGDRSRSRGMSMLSAKRQSCRWGPLQKGPGSTTKVKPSVRFGTETRD